MIDRWKQKSKYKHQHTFIIQKEYHGNGHDAFYHFIINYFNFVNFINDAISIKFLCMEINKF